jgi:hypothetical protein
MRNYAEELGYWYFRFNGFFLLNNYVNHPDDRQDNYTSDSDLIGVKMPYSKEVIGLNDDRDICRKLFELLDYGNSRGYIHGFICEVKAGESEFLLSNANLPSQIRRLGFFNLEDQVQQVVESIVSTGVFQDHMYRIVRIIICRRDNRSGDLVSWNRINLETIINYISNERFENYEVKFTGWDKFDSTLIQFLLRHRDIVHIVRQ